MLAVELAANSLYGSLLKVFGRCPHEEAALFQLATLNPNILPFVVDVSNRTTMGRKMMVKELVGIELAILNAGSLQNMGAEDYDAGTAARLMPVN